MGANVALELWARRPATAGLLLLHGLGAIPEAPRPGMPVHGAPGGAGRVRGRGAEIAGWRRPRPPGGVAAEVFRYPGAGHLFTDDAIADHDAAAAALLWRARDSAFLRPRSTEKEPR